MSHFECDDVVNLKEYVGYNIERNYEKGVWGCLKFTQPVLIQSFNDDFDLHEGRALVTTSDPGKILECGSPQNWVPQSVQKMYCSGVGKI